MFNHLDMWRTKHIWWTSHFNNRWHLTQCQNEYVILISDRLTILITDVQSFWCLVLDFDIRWTDNLDNYRTHHFDNGCTKHFDIWWAFWYLISDHTLFWCLHGHCNISDILISAISDGQIILIFNDIKNLCCCCLDVMISIFFYQLIFPTAAACRTVVSGQHQGRSWEVLARRSRQTIDIWFSLHW